MGCFEDTVPRLVNIFEMQLRGDVMPYFLCLLLLLINNIQRWRLFQLRSVFYVGYGGGGGHGQRRGYNDRENY